MLMRTKQLRIWPVVVLVSGGLAVAWAGADSGSERRDVTTLCGKGRGAGGTKEAGGGVALRYSRAACVRGVHLGVVGMRRWGHRRP